MHTYRSLLRHARTTSVALAALTLTACGGTDGGSSSAHSAGADHSQSAAPAASGAAAGKHNAADTAFAKEMIQHHRQALQMARLARTRAESGQVKTLASAIKKTQDPEIATMSGWLKSWGEKVPAGDQHDMGHGMDHGGASPMPGMMNDGQLAKLKGASGKEFDTAFLTMMVEHHQGAVAMAETEKKRGAHAQAKKLADGVITTQTAEIAMMRKMLKAS